MTETRAQRESLFIDFLKLYLLVNGFSPRNIMSPGRKRRYTHRWKSDVGRITVQGIVKARFSEWTDGLRDWQLDIVVRILDGEDVLLSTATGDGKSAIFTVPIVVLLEMRQDPGSYPQLPYRDFPMGIVIAPTKGLAANIVLNCAQELVLFAGLENFYWKFEMS